MSSSSSTSPVVFDRTQLSPRSLDNHLRTAIHIKFWSFPVFDSRFLSGSEHAALRGACIGTKVGHKQHLREEVQRALNLHDAHPHDRWLRERCNWQVVFIARRGLPEALQILPL